MSNEPKYTVIPVGDLLPGEPCERWEKDSADHYCHMYNTGDLPFAPDEFAHEGQGFRAHAIVALPRPSKAPESPRYVVRLAADAQPDEPGYWCDTVGAAEGVAKRWNAGSPIGTAMFETFERDMPKFDPRHPIRAGVVDLHDSWHRIRDAFGEPPTNRAFPTAASPAPVKAEPVGPTDAEVVAAYEEHQRCDEAVRIMIVGGLEVAGRFVPWASVRAAWSRVLAARVRASAERERRSIACEGDLPCELIGHDLGGEG